MLANLSNPILVGYVYPHVVFRVVLGEVDPHAIALPLNDASLQPASLLVLDV